MSVFVSHDGDGTEVYVATAKGKVTRIEEKGNAAVNAIIESAYLEYPLNGWLNKDEAIYETLLKAKESGEEVEVRIESCRKPGIDRATPIKELRENNANKNIIKKLVSVNGVFTAEALTNPEDDPVSGRPTSALHSPRPAGAPAATGGGSSADKETILNVLRSSVTSREVSAGVVDALKAQALLQGATAAEVTEAATLHPDSAPETVQNNYSVEAPAFKTYNSDGRLNLGGPAPAAGVGAQTYVYENLVKQTGETPKDSTVSFFAALLLAIADRIQVSSYGTGFRSDREAGSHTRIRSVIYALSPKFPVNESGDPAGHDVVEAWVMVLGKTARSMFLEAVKNSQEKFTVSGLLDTLKDKSTSITEGQPNVTVVETKPIVSPDVTPAPALVDSNPNDELEGQSVVATPSVATNPEDDAEGQSVTATAPVADEPAAPVMDDDVMLFDQDLLPPGAINSSNAPDEELLEGFKTFVIEEVGLKSKSDLAQVSKLLSYTFGKAYNKAQNIPNEKLGDFLDFYVMAGADNFKKALQQFA